MASFSFLKLFKPVQDLCTFARFYYKKRQQLKNTPLSTGGEVSNYQFGQLKKILDYAYKDVPYYTRLFNEVKFHPDDFRSLEDIKKIPYIDKNIIRQNQQDLISKSFPEKYLKYEHTGGTTGLPLDFVLDKRTSSPYETAYLENIWRTVGYRRYDRCIVLRQDHVPGIIEGKKYWKINRMTNWLTMSAFHLNEDTFEVFYKKIIDFKPRFIIAFPSNAYLLAKFIKERDYQPLSSLRGIICSSENMYDWQRKFMEETYRVRVFSYYGHSEKCALAAECNNSTDYRFHPQYGFVELINENNDWCSADGEKGEIVVTGFNNYASPLIRYRTDDIGIYTTRRCGVTPHWLTIKKIEGRIQDFVVDADGTPKTAIHIDRPFWNIRDKIYAYQYIQDIPGKLKLLIHPIDKLDNQQIESIRKLFADAYFKTELDVEQVEYIPRTKTGKFKYLVQNIKKYDLNSAR